MIWKKYTHSITTRLIVNVILIHAVLMGLIVFDMLDRESEFMHKQFVSKGYDLTTILASNTSSALLNNDLVALGELIGEMDKVDALYMVFILDKAGKVRASHPAEYFNKTLTDPFSQNLFKSIENSHEDVTQVLHEEFMDTVSKIYVDEEVIGYARILLDTQTLSQELQLITKKGAVYILLAIVLGALFAWLSVNKMTLNLNRITAAAKKISEHDFEVVLPEIKSSDEIGAMGKAFSVMQASIHEYIQTIDESQKRLNLALEGSRDGLWDWDLTTNEVYFSLGYKQMLGYSEDELPNTLKAWEEGLHPDDLQNALAFVKAFLNSSDINFELRFRLRNKSGEYIPILSRAKKVFNDKGEAVRLIGTHVDMSEIVKMQTFLQTVIDGTDIPLMVINKDYSVSLMSQAAQNMKNDRLIADINSPKCYEISHHRSTPCDGIEHPCPLQDAMEHKRVNKMVHLHEDKEGNKQVVELSVYPILDENGNVESIVEAAYDITSLVQAKDTLRHQAEHDVLTDLPNRILFLDRLKQAIKHAARNDEKIAVLFLDLDHFKEVNDSLGHDAGDELLKKISELLQKAIRESDTVARIGGDEFTVIIDKITNNDVVVDVIQKIVQCMRTSHHIKGKEFYTTFSIGIALYPDDGTGADELMKNADAAMYRAKAEGRNTYQFYTNDMTEKALERILMEASLRQALEKEEFEVYYQPQIDARNSDIIGFEALIRWNHPDMGFVSPGMFIPLAEETGLIIAIDKWVMRTAMRQFALWNLQDKSIRLSLNLSVLQLSNDNFIDELQSMLLESGCQTERIELEVTESQIMKNPEVAIAQLKRINELGIKLAMDDFGTGYSSLAYLKKLPIQKLKIDQSFIRDLMHDEDDRELVRTIIAMAHNLKLDVIAEGVETIEEQNFLMKHGCFLIQGYYHYRPMPSDEIGKLLRASV